jgi:hypothetical protein
MQVNAIDSVACQFSLLSTRRTARKVGPSCSPPFYLGYFSLGKRMVTIPIPFTTVSCFAWCRERQKHPH